jgi:hypothetical protein
MNACAAEREAHRLSDDPITDRRSGWRRERPAVRHFRFFRGSNIQARMGRIGTP